MCRDTNQSMLQNKDRLLSQNIDQSMFCTKDQSVSCIKDQSVKTSISLLFHIRRMFTMLLIDVIITG